jgi:hypothetical protein
VERREAVWLCQAIVRLAGKHRLTAYNAAYLDLGAAGEVADHAYEPDFLVRLRNGITVVLEIKGFEDDRANAKHNAAKRWIEAVNNWGRLGRWNFHVCRNPQLLGRELEYVLR